MPPQPLLPFLKNSSDQNLRLIDAYFLKDQPELDLSEITLADSLSLLQNKYTLIPHSWTHKDIPDNLTPFTREKIIQQINMHKYWHSMLEKSLDIANHIEMDYVLIKALACPFAPMSDVDYLVPEHRHIANFTQTLEDHDFTLNQFRLLADPFKIMGKLDNQPAENDIAIDIYPAAKWVQKIVLDANVIIQRRIQSPVRGLKVWQPCIEDNVYLVATHAVARGNIMLGELDHFIRLIRQSEFNWGLLTRSAIAYGCLDSIYIFLFLANLVCENTDNLPPVPGEVLDQFSMIGNNKSISRWLGEIDYLAFPLEIPIRFNILRSGLFHFPAMFLRGNFKDVVMDAASYGMNVVTTIMKRN